MVTCGLNIYSITRSVINNNGLKSILRNQSRNAWKVRYSRAISDDAPNKSIKNSDTKLVIGDKEYDKDAWTNVTPKILSLMNRQLHNEKHHPLQLIKERIANYMYQRYPGPFSPLFSLHDRLHPIVTTAANFDSLLVPPGHVSRKKSDSYYVNQTHMLRAHTSAHQSDLIKMGLDNFLVVGDVYRRDEIDATHYPVFHQVEGVRLVNEIDLTKLSGNNFDENLIKGFEDGERNDKKQKFHTQEAAILLEHDLKSCLLGLTKELFGPNIEYKWVECYFPFTHPSWELEIFYNDKWLEVLGCGIMEQEILFNAGAQDKMGFAFGLGLERLAMVLYQIPDIRLFWSNDSGFRNQFITDDVKKPIVYRPISKSPQCINDISFWLPTAPPQSSGEELFCRNDFFDLIRSIGGDLIEQVECFDEFFHPKKQRHSQSYRITYRHMDRTLTQEEVNKIHSEIEKAVVEKLNVEIR